MHPHLRQREGVGERVDHKHVRIVLGAGADADLGHPALPDRVDLRPDVLATLVGDQQHRPRVRRPGQAVDTGREVHRLGVRDGGRHLRVGQLLEVDRPALPDVRRSRPLAGREPPRPAGRLVRLVRLGLSGVGVYRERRQRGRGLPLQFRCQTSRVLVDLPRLVALQAGSQGGVRVGPRHGGLGGDGRRVHQPPAGRRQPLPVPVARLVEVGEDLAGHRDRRGVVLRRGVDEPAQEVQRTLGRCGARRGADLVAQPGRRVGHQSLRRGVVGGPARQEGPPVAGQVGRQLVGEPVGGQHPHAAAVQCRAAHEEHGVVHRPPAGALGGHALDGRAGRCRHGRASRCRRRLGGRWRRRLGGRGRGDGRGWPHRSRHPGEVRPQVEPRRRRWPALLPVELRPQLPDLVAESPLRVRVASRERLAPEAVEVPQLGLPRGQAVTAIDVPGRQGVQGTQQRAERALPVRVPGLVLQGVGDLVYPRAGDLVVGDPLAEPHPVRVLGRAGVHLRARHQPPRPEPEPPARRQVPGPRDHEVLHGETRGAHRYRATGVGDAVGAGDVRLVDAGHQ